tara:strand:+ start:149 stop:349 length:201 start_codon:yes stop_codon:yes gene_type:complete
MEQASNLVESFPNLLVEKLFWLGIGIFLGATFLKACITAINSQQSNSKKMEKVLRRIAQKAIQNDD